MTERALFFAALAITLLASLLYVRSRVWFIELNYEIAEKRALQKQLEEDKRAFTLELATLKRPARIERLASRRYGLNRSQSSVTTIIVKDEESRE